MAMLSQDEFPPYGKERDVAEYTGVSVPTLRRRRWEGLPPKFIKIGNSVRYPKADLLAWLDSLAAGEEAG